MKVQEFKKLIKEAVREVLREESVAVSNPTVKESTSMFTEIKKTPNTTITSQKDSILDALTETAQNGSWRSALNMTTLDVPTEGASYSPGEQLIAGEVPLDTIIKLMNGNRS